MNTEISYLYRDASNYKQHMTVVLSGVISDEDKQLIKAKLDDGEFFIPSQVGLPDLQEMMIDGFDEDEDHVWHELLNIEITASDPTYDLTGDDLVRRFKAVKEWLVDARWGEMTMGAERKRVTK